MLLMLILIVIPPYILLKNKEFEKRKIWKSLIYMDKLEDLMVH